MKIVVLDGYTCNPGDLDWNGLKPFGEVTIYDRTPKELILERAAGAEILLTNKTPLAAPTLEMLPDLKYIGVLATGYNVVDVQAAAKRGVKVTNIPTYGTNSVAQLVFALLLELCIRTGEHSELVHQSEWTRSVDFCFWRYPLVELADKTIGLFGLGQIGSRAARIADAFGMRVLAYDKAKKNPPEVRDFAWVEPDDLFRRADVVSLHVPLFPETQGLINHRTLGLMKPTAFLINTARGGLVVEKDLAEALNAGRIAGAGVDVLSTEPPSADNPLLSAKNCIITPHLAWATHEARARLINIAVENIRQFLAGSPINVVK